MKFYILLFFISLSMVTFGQRSNAKLYDVEIKCANYAGSGWNYFDWYNTYCYWRSETVKTCTRVVTKYKSGDIIEIRCKTPSRAMQVILTVNNDTIIDYKMEEKTKKTFKYKLP